MDQHLITDNLSDLNMIEKYSFSIIKSGMSIKD